MQLATSIFSCKLRQRCLCACVTDIHLGRRYIFFIYTHIFLSIYLFFSALRISCQTTNKAGWAKRARPWSSRARPGQVRPGRARPGHVAAAAARLFYDISVTRLIKKKLAQCLLRKRRRLHQSAKREQQLLAAGGRHRCKRGKEGGGGVGSTAHAHTQQLHYFAGGFALATKFNNPIARCTYAAAATFHVVPPDTADTVDTRLVFIIVAGQKKEEAAAKITDKRLMCQMQEQHVAAATSCCCCCKLLMLPVVAAACCCLCIGQR